MYNKILKLCHEAGISIADLSNETGVRQSTLSNLKKRGGSLSTKNAYTIARYFGVSIEDLMEEVANA